MCQSLFSSNFLLGSAPSHIVSFSGEKTPFSSHSMAVRTIEAIAASKATGRNYVLETIKRERNIHSER